MIDQNLGTEPGLPFDDTPGEPVAPDSIEAPPSLQQTSSVSPDDDDDRRRLRRVVRVLLISMGVLFMVRVFVLEPYGIPLDTPSMAPTVLPGDVMLVNKLPYVVRSLRYIPFTHISIPYMEFDGFGELERGDVVVFDYPMHLPAAGGGEQYVKRCVAVAGDTVQLLEGRIRVNGREVPSAATEPGGRRAPIDSTRAYEPLRYGNSVVIPYRGMSIRMDSVTQRRWRGLIEGEGLTLSYRNRIVFIGGLPATVYTVRHNYFFALGDNSRNSRDSRYFGFVPYENLVGRAWLIYWSRDDDGVRWNRILHGVR